MINQLKLVRCHPLFWLMTAAAVFTGFFYEWLLLVCIVFLHELSHAQAALFYKWRIKKLELLPFGGVMETAEHGNRPVHEEAIVAAAGPFVHLPLIICSYLLLETPFWHTADHSLFLQYNLTILLFNLLPVWPLDGGKLLFCWLSFRYPYYQAQKRGWMISLCILLIGAAIFFWFFPLHIQAWILLVFFIVVHYTEWKQRPYGFFRFLLERANTNTHTSQVAQEISWHLRPIDAAKMIRKNQASRFYITENGQTLSESYILEAITKNKTGFRKLRDLFIEEDKNPSIKG
ncbi:M50 family metallopeptidase [Alteribacillus persepolensis]|uniref:M50 family metallopeptidase n=1 Tax=Alteribacillus persepolensis TaxID=568899 RepID=UPI000B897866|nr:M50 family metallopeptidase [Alteribacillus persepolensis]